MRREKKVDETGLDKMRKKGEKHETRRKDKKNEDEEKRQEEMR